MVVFIGDHVWSHVDPCSLRYLHRVHHAVRVDAPLDRFSEARAIEHVRVLAHEIDGRQEGRQGLREAAEYIKAQLEKLEERAGSNFRIEIEENVVVGPLGSPGAGDCGSCVASLLEISRLTIDSGWVPPRPIILLFNGCKWFRETHKWCDTIGAFINVEASGSGGLDLICQSGPGSWPSSVYAQSAIYPMAHYRMFSEDYGNIPGLDIILLLGGYYYHTSYDTVDRLVPGSIQARGDNLYSTVKAFAESSKLKNGHERESLGVSDEYDDGRVVFFDYLTWFMIFYSRRIAVVLHSVPTHYAFLFMFSEFWVVVLLNNLQ
ncbi:putative Signal peptidase complex subunit [Hibiscus syriacus]|uniref:Signal peptidase complex subunit n=1 Tax=Hibiscus syriacus TaxID=106335 RepID=A0A6A3B9E1_HIBSY|nr:putative Signal peptidase complex subunit [Hibiscus syriacus]